MTARAAALCGAALTLMLAGTASAQQLTYTPINPTFGGNPFNSSHLLGLAGAQNQFLPKTTTSAPLTQAELFAQQLQGQLLSGVATQISNAIFGENPVNSGQVSFGGTNVSFVRGLGQVTVNITDPQGVTTTINVPTFQTASTGG